MIALTQGSLDVLDEVAALAAATPQAELWPRADLAEVFTGFARARGAHTAVARRSGRAVGFAGWVALAEARGEFYASPLFAAEPEAADRLIERLVEEAGAAGARWVRASAPEPDEIVRAALERAGFTARLSFLTLRRPLPLAPLPLQPDLRHLPLDRADPTAWTELSNATFSGVDNAPPITAAQAAEHLSDPTLHPSASGLWISEGDRPVAFLAVTREGEIDSVGVSADQRSRGLAASLIARAGGLLHAEGIPALTSLVASTNEPSLRLHRRLGFAEVARRDVFQRDLRG